MKLKAELDGVQAVFQNNIDQIKALAPGSRQAGGIRYLKTGWPGIV